MFFPSLPCGRTDGRADWVLNQKSLAGGRRGIKLPAETLKGLEQRATRALPFAFVAPCSGCGEKRGTGDSSPLQKRTENCLCVIPDSLFSFLPPFLPYFNFVQQWGNNVGMKRDRERERSLSACPIRHSGGGGSTKKGGDTTKQCSSRLVGQFGFGILDSAQDAAAETLSILL